MRARVLVMAVGVVLVTAGTAVATEGYPWSDHAAPFSFAFGNHIDTHQQSLTRNAMVQGFFYVTLQDRTDPGSGLPVATHGDCGANPDGYSVGWVWHGTQVTANLLSHGHGQHPTWCLDPALFPRQPGYTHFHWVGPPDHAGGLQPGDVANGWLLRLTAVDSFFFEHHGGFAITPGVDYESHANVSTTCEEQTRPPTWPWLAPHATFFDAGAPGGDRTSERGIRTAHEVSTALGYRVVDVGAGCRRNSRKPLCRGLARNAQ